MREVKIRVEVYRVRAMCECGGEFKPTGVSYPLYPVQYLHECNRCGKLEKYEYRYPREESQ